MSIVSERFGVSALGGLHLPGARLWLDGRPRSGLAFVADHRSRPPRRTRLLCSEGLARLWGSGSTRELAPPHGASFQLGRLRLSLWPAGSTPGAAMLAVEGGERDLLVATAARLETLPPARPMPRYDADVLLLDARLGDVEHAGSGHLRFAVAESVEQLGEGSRGAVWLFDDPMIGLAIAHAAGDPVPIYANLSLKRLSWRYAAAGFAVPRIHRLGSRARAGSLILWPASRADALRDRATDEMPWTLCAERADGAMADQVGAEHFLPFSRRASGTELDRLALYTRARDVLAFGHGAAALADRLAERGVRCWRLEGDRQLRLWG